VHYIRRVRAYFICVLSMYIIYFALVGIYVHTHIHIYIYIYSHSAVATATVLQTIRPSCVCPPTSDPSPPTQTLALRSTSPVIQPSFPPICNPPPGQSLPIYIPYTTSSSVPGRARRVIYAPPSSPPPPPSHCTSTTAHPLQRHQDSIYYNGIYVHSVSVFLPLYVLYEFRSSTLCRVDGPMTCTIT